MSHRSSPIRSKRASGILTLPDSYLDRSTSDLKVIIDRFKAALRRSDLIVTEPDFKFTPLPPIKPRIRLAWTERGHR